MTKSTVAPIVHWQRQRMPFLSGAENKQTFFKRVAAFLPELDPRYQLIRRAYEDMKEAFDGDERDSGVRYFEHLRGVSLIQLEYLEVRDYEDVASGLLHDCVEDKPRWPIDRVREVYGENIALKVSFMTQPNATEFGSKAAAERVFHARLEFAPFPVIRTKLSDRLHNLLTLDARPREKQIAKIEETERYYMPLARKHGVLLPELREVLQILRTST